MNSPARPVIRTKAVEAIAERLRQRAGDPAALLGSDCPACGVLGRTWSDEDPDEAKAAAAEALSAVAKPERGWSLRECRRCGALFAQTASGPPAADDLFAVTVHLDRISIAQAIEMLPAESAHADCERTVDQALALVLAGASFLSNFSRVQESRVGEERFIFRDGDVILDAWHVKETGTLGELTSYALDDFEKGLPALFPGDSVSSRFVVPIERIPDVVRREAPRRFRRFQDLRAALSDGARWVRLATFEPAAPRRTGPRRVKKHSVRREAGKATGAPHVAYLYRGPVAGWQYVTCEDGRVTSVKVDAEALAERRLDEILRSGPAVSAEVVPPEVRARLGQIESRVADALARLESGEGCAHPLGVMVAIGGRFVVAALVGNLVENLVELDRARALDHLASELARAKALTFVPMAKADRERVAALLDPDARWQLFLDGRLVVGGGPTTDMQWTLACENGRFRFDDTNGSERIEEARARGIVRDKRYGWLRVT